MPFETYVTVRFGETDAMGHVNNVSYYIYFEQARVEFLKNLGFALGTDSNSLNFVVVRTSCDYIKQSYFDQELIVSTYVSRIGTKSFTLQHDVLDKKTHVLIAKGCSIAVIIDKEQNGALPIPYELKNALQSNLISREETSASVK